MWPSAPTHSTVTREGYQACGWMWTKWNAATGHTSATLVANLCVDHCELAGKCLAVIQRLYLNPCSKWCQFPNLIVWKINHVNLITEWCQELTWFWMFLHPCTSSSAKFISSGSISPDAICLALRNLLALQVTHLVCSSSVNFHGKCPTMSQVLLRGCGCLLLLCLPVFTFSTGKPLWVFLSLYKEQMLWFSPKWRHTCSQLLSAC